MTKRPVSVTFVAICFVLLGALLLKGSTVRLMKHHDRGGLEHLLWGVGLLAVGGWLIVDDIGLWRLRSWSRNPAIVTAGGLMSIVFVYALQKKGVVQ